MSNNCVRLEIKMNSLLAQLGKILQSKKMFVNLRCTIALQHITKKMK